MTDLPANAIRFPTRVRVVNNNDCQSEDAPTTKHMLLIDALRDKQAKERRTNDAKHAWIEFRNSYAELVKATFPDDPCDHAVKYIEDMRGRRHD